MIALEKITEKILACEWHWLKYHFLSNKGSCAHPLCQSISNSCDICEQHMPGFAEEFSKRLSSYRDREKYLPHYEQIIQLLSELLVISHLASLSLDGFRYVHEPTAEGSDKNPELGMYSNIHEMFVEVKCREYINHHNKRSDKEIQLPARMEIFKNDNKHSSIKDNVLLPKDNPIKDYLISADEKFKNFKKLNPDSICVLVIVWDDFIYEPITSLINQHSGLLTENSFFKKEDGSPVIFNNIDAIVIVRHSHHIVRATRDEPLTDEIRHPLDWAYKMNLLPKALIPISEKDEDIKFLIKLFDAIPIAELQHIAEYRPQEYIMWI